MIAHVVKITSTVASPVVRNFTSFFNLKWFYKRLVSERLKLPATIIPQLVNLASATVKLGNRWSIKRLPSDSAGLIRS